ncbi:MAG: hypothetical protein K2Z81_17330 [Cyanobacteria bacterium]|nr:hypothetical protein [Cyanobacteriota bacterium]
MHDPLEHARAIQAAFREFNDLLTSYRNDWGATQAEVLEAEKKYRRALDEYEQTFPK